MMIINRGAGFIVASFYCCLNKRLESLCCSCVIFILSGLSWQELMHEVWVHFNKNSLHLWDEIPKTISCKKEKHSFFRGGWKGSIFIFGILPSQQLSLCRTGNFVSMVIHSTSQNRRSYPTGRCH